MFDFHMHSTVSFDGHDTGLAMAMAAKAAGLQEICFTDHMDYEPGAAVQTMLYDLDAYSREYDGLEVPGLKIRRGMEFGMAPDNAAQLRADMAKRHYDFVLGSVHFVGRHDVYFAPYWEGKTVLQAEREYLEETLRCVQAHNDFDVLAHMNFVSKAKDHPTHTALRYQDHCEVIDEILKVLVQKGKGLELNTSGMDRCGAFLPDETVFRRFRELGGEIVTVGSDAHQTQRVGQYAPEACRLLGSIFGHVCTFADRKPVFHSMKNMAR